MMQATHASEASVLTRSTPGNIHVISMLYPYYVVYILLLGLIEDADRG
jgi:hypothetical protein